ncbi:bifunctional adenosylcobinamide kinase/adenosylcobinamide-phosphate guanylyltransferase [Pyxidicoccus fallax]|uniref:Adenosylcobinamide kinase n=1 Tax=Pyxidicoccus fallax TaxID=394095 RepID=A0A848LBY9_9BACT|nr:bifunctional adenosylcobinamide kinase/adenosylcobinamide-phosphate guanylyltransferase [Pyxidicoccus fallax]NMO16449.1 bifunctional adenosylcobinamide kinase/adenosylcobinamide-phosphate guanylyltransferase [Pyxidicoccus fallax]NPC79484.1 bifunctional adenosylcobinamide kinase/adenosylcobinamide-phosphate guanylyltransferase [Pyxidicoccus fallax]
MSARIILVGGGVRSGKSAFAVRLAEKLGERRTYFATAQAFDDEMRERARRHQAERAGRFVTVEEPIALCERLEADTSDVAVVDCVTLWLSNLLLRGDSPDAILSEVERLTSVLRARAGATVLVTNEVGMGVVPDTPLGRVFRDVSGGAHQRLAACADEVYFGALGLLLRLKPSPLVLEATP